jgi:ABC-type nitrate/sulfonate/bicarbonate transport system substrate-binding protein
MFFIRTSLCIVTIIAALSTAARADETKLENLTMAIPTFSLAFAHEYLNEDAGIYRKHGLNVKTVQLDGLTTINAVISGSVDFGQASGSSLTRAAAKGQRLLALALLNDHPSTQVVMRSEILEKAGFDPKAPLEKRAQILKGRTLGMAGVNSVLYTYVLLIAKRSGFGPDDMHLGVIPPPEMNAAFQRKQIDGFANAVPWTMMPVIAGTAGIVSAGDNGDLPDLLPFGSSVVLTKPDNCVKRKAVCAAIGQSFVESAAMMHDHPAEAEAILKKRFAAMDDKVFAASFQMARKTFPSPPVSSSKAFENADRYNVEAGLMKQEEMLASYEGLFTNEFLK